jgi:hypothetical protein
MFDDRWRRGIENAFSGGIGAVALPSLAGESAGCGAKLSREIVLAAIDAHLRDPKKYSVANLAAHYGVTRNTMHRAMQRGRSYGQRVSTRDEALNAKRAEMRARLGLM